MAYAFGLPKDVTERIYSMRDWRLEKVKAKGGTRLSREVMVWRDPTAPFYFNNHDMGERAKWLYTRRDYLRDYEPNWSVWWSGRSGVGFFEIQDAVVIGRASRPYTFESQTESKNKKLNIPACCKDLSRPVDHFVCQPCDDEESRIMMGRINAL